MRTGFSRWHDSGSTRRPVVNSIEWSPKMTKEQALAVFEDYQIRRVYDEASDTWYFSVVDVVRALTDSANPRDYWLIMKIRVKTEGRLELSTPCRQLHCIGSDRSEHKQIAETGQPEGWSNTKRSESVTERNRLNPKKSADTERPWKFPPGPFCLPNAVSPPPPPAAFSSARRDSAGRRRR